MVKVHKRGFVASRCYRSILVRLTEIAVIHSQETRTGHRLNATFSVAVSIFCALSTPPDRHQQIQDLLIHSRYYRHHSNALRTGDADLRLYITTVQDG